MFSIIGQTYLSIGPAGFPIHTQFNPLVTVLIFVDVLPFIPHAGQDQPQGSGCSGAGILTFDEYPKWCPVILAIHGIVTEAAVVGNNLRRSGCALQIADTGGDCGSNLLRDLQC